MLVKDDASSVDSGEYDDDEVLVVRTYKPRSWNKEAHQSQWCGVPS